MEVVIPVICFVVGLVLGVIGIILLKRSGEQERKNEIDSLRSVLHTTQIELATAQAQVENSGHLQEEIAVLESAIEALREQTSSQSADLARLEATLKEKQEAFEAQAKERDAVETRFKETFEALASDALRRNNATFLELANEKLDNFGKLSDAEMEKRKLAIEGLVSPISQTLLKFEEQIKEIETKREGAYAGLNEVIQNVQQSNERLRLQTSNLVGALKNTPQRGRWGEYELKRVFEYAGLIEGVHYELQTSVEAEDSRRRPDAVVKLPNEKNIIVDAKAVDTGFFTGHEIDDDERRTVLFTEFSAAVRRAIVNLSTKAYFQNYNSPEFVVMFLPHDSYLMVALHYDHDLLEFAYKKNIVLATPTSLVAMLRTISQTWREDKLSRDAHEMGKTGTELLSRVEVFLGHFKKIGEQLNRAQNCYDQAQKSFSSRILPSARKLEQLGAKGGKSLDAPDAVAVIISDSPADAKLALEGLFEVDGEQQDSLPAGFDSESELETDPA